MDSTFEELEREVEQTVKDELERFYNMSGIMVQMLMFDAEK